MRFGGRIRELKNANEWSLRELAEKVDVGFKYVRRVENGRLS